MILEMILGIDQMPESSVFTNEQMGFESVGPKEQVIGVVSVRGQKLFTLINKQNEIIRAKIDKISKTFVLAEIEEAKEEIKKLAEVSEILSKIFWKEVQEENTGLEDFPVIALRKNWQIVAIPENQVPTARIIIGPIDEEVSVLEAIQILFDSSESCDNPDCKTCHPQVNLKPN